MNKIKLAYLVDDDHISNFLTGKILENAGFCEELIIFQDAHRALLALEDIIRSGGPMPEMILFDLNMPEMDGWGFIERFSSLSISNPLPTFIYTSSIDPSDREKSESYKAITDFVTKPLTIPKLDKIMQMLRGDRSNSNISMIDAQ